MVDDIWHAGEQELQDSAGLKELMAVIGKKVIRDYMPDQHRNFFEQLPFIIVGSVDDDNNVWAGIRSGGIGFIESPDPSRLLIKGSTVPDDPIEGGLKRNSAIGLLGIELHTKRRNRLNGYISEKNEEKLEIQVAQSFGNCPRFIEGNHLRVLRVEPGSSRVLESLSDTHLKLVQSSERFFVASFADIGQQRQVDVSHRGGKPGFVEVANDGWLVVPDYMGNNFFATLGNILLNSKAGLTFIDFENQEMLQMTGNAEVISTEETIGSSKEVQRYWRFKPAKIYSHKIVVD